MEQAERVFVRPPRFHPEAGVVRLTRRGPLYDCRLIRLHDGIERGKFYGFPACALPPSASPIHGLRCPLNDCVEAARFPRVTGSHADVHPGDRIAGCVEDAHGHIEVVGGASAIAPCQSDSETTPNEEYREKSRGYGHGNRGHKANRETTD
jgi:hypothetical protein